VRPALNNRLHRQAIVFCALRMRRPFKQIDVFSCVPLQGNSLVVILDADGLTGEQMPAIPRWARRMGCSRRAYNPKPPVSRLAPVASASNRRRTSIGTT